MRSMFFSSMIIFRAEKRSYLIKEVLFFFFRESRADGYHNICTRGKAASIFSENFPDYPLNPITQNRVSNFFGNAYSQPVTGLIIQGINHGKTVSMNSAARPVHLIELP